MINFVAVSWQCLKNKLIPSLGLLPCKWNLKYIASGTKQRKSKDWENGRYTGDWKLASYGMYWPTIDNLTSYGMYWKLASYGMYWPTTGQQLANNWYSGNNLQVRNFCLINIICDDVMLKRTSVLSLTERFRIRFGSIFLCSWIFISITVIQRTIFK